MTSKIMERDALFPPHEKSWEDGVNESFEGSSILNDKKGSIH